MSYKGIKCEATFKGTVDKNMFCRAPGQDQRAVRRARSESPEFSLTMAADNQSWLGDIYDSVARIPPSTRRTGPGAGR